MTTVCTLKLVFGLIVAIGVVNSPTLATSCEIVKKEDYAYWSERLDEADVALEKATSNYTENELSEVRKMITDNPGEKKYITCQWGLERIINGRLNEDTTINFSDELNEVYREFWSGRASAHYFLINLLRFADRCGEDFELEAISLRAQESYDKKLYALRECPY